jgi:hypothetical protein
LTFEQVNVGRHDVWLDLISRCLAWIPGVLNRIHGCQEIHGLFPVPAASERHWNPERAVRILTAIFPDARQVTFDVAGIARRIVEWGREEEEHPEISPEQPVLN